MPQSESQSLRVAMLARVVFPLHGFGGIERHVFHLVTHLARLGVRVTLYVQNPTEDMRQETRDKRYETGDHGWPSVDSPVSRLSSLVSMVFLRYDYTSPYLRPNSILGRQINYPWYTWQLGRRV